MGMRQAGRGPLHVGMHVLGMARHDGRVLREATALIEAGWRVSIVDIESASCGEQMEVLRGIRLHHVIVSSAFLRSRFAHHSWLRAISILTRSTLTLLRIRADIYHAHDVSGLFPCWIAACVRRKPLVFDAHELPLDAMSIHTPWLLALLAGLLRLIVPRCAGVITVSSPIARQMQRLYHARTVLLLRNTPAYQMIVPGDHLHRLADLSPKTRIALYQGHVQTSRGLDVLVRAAPFLEPGIVIVIMGKGFGTTVPQLEELIARLGVADRVKMIDPVDYAVLLECTASADVGLILYRPGFSRNVQWCLPNKLFEYLMAGLPVIASPLDAVAEVLTTYHVGCVVDVLTPEAIATTLNRLLADTTALARMRANALHAAQSELCWDKEKYQLLQLYQQMEKGLVR